MHGAGDPPGVFKRSALIGTAQFPTLAQKGCWRSARVRASSRMMAAEGVTLALLSTFLPLMVTLTRLVRSKTSGESQTVALLAPVFTVRPLVRSTSPFTSAARAEGVLVHSTGRM